MTRMRLVLLAIVVLAIALAVGAALFGVGSDAETPDTARSAVPAEPVPDGPPLYYQHPDGKPEYSAGPKKTVDNRDFVPIYRDEPVQEAQNKVAQAPVAPKDKGKILYYRNPMGLPDTSPVPKKDSMGMDYIPVHENEVSSAGLVQVDPGRMQMLGVRTAPVERRASLTRTVRATGIVGFDERRLGVVTTKAGGWIEKLHVAATGDTVKTGQTLLELFSPELVAAEEEYLAARALHHESSLAEAAARRLAALGVPEPEIARLKRTGKASRLIPIGAPADGIVIEKMAVEGMRIAPETVLYRTADLSTVWIMAEVQEQDLGALRPGAKAAARFVAFPGRRFEGTVDFIYPTLSQETRTAKVRIVTPNPDLTLRADMYASVEIQSSAEAGDVLAVPESALIDSGARQTVLIERGEGRYEPRQVEIGARGDGVVEILSGLTEGERVVTGANFLIDSESNLRAALQAFAPSAEGTTP